MNRDVILFDLDGTLIESSEGIIGSAEYALGQMGYDVGDMSKLRAFIGPPLIDSFKILYGMDDETAQEAVRVYRVRYMDWGVHRNTLYPRCEKLLQTLKDKGCTLALATTKYKKPAQQILDELGISKYFSFTAGSELDGTRVDKVELISYALENLGASPDRAVMIGDRKYDINGAVNSGIPGVGVLYGFGDREELEAAGASYIVKDMQELEQVLLNFI